MSEFTLHEVPLELQPRTGNAGNVFQSKTEFDLSFKTNYGSKVCIERIHSKTKQKYFLVQNAVAAIWDESNNQGVIFK